MRYMLPPLTPNPVIDAYKQGIDITLIRCNLQLTPNERSRQLEEMRKLHEEIRSAVTTVKKYGFRQLSTRERR